MDIGTYLPEIQQALSDEINQLKSLKGQHIDLEDGLLVDTQVAEGRSRYLYIFTADKELNALEDSRAMLTYKDNQYEVVVVSVVEYSVLLAANENLGNTVHYVRLSMEPWFLLEELRNRLEHISNDPAKNQQFNFLLNTQDIGVTEPDLTLAQTLLTSLEPVDDHHATQSDASTPLPMSSQKRFHKNAGGQTSFDTGVELKITDSATTDIVYNEQQIRAVGHILVNSVSFIWGPPGTGKSRTLGMAAAALFARKESILVLAHSNAAVDVAMANVARHLFNTNAYTDGKILRYGPTSSQVLQKQYPKVLVRGILAEKYPQLLDELEKLELRLRHNMKQLRDKTTSPQQKRTLKTIVETLKKKRKKLTDELRNKERLLVTQAYIVGCTLSKATISDVIYDIREFDAVFIDEASMAYIPHCLYAASWLSRRRIAFFGDFRQLAPICLTKTKAAQSWLQRDIFELVGIRAKLEEKAQQQERMIKQHEQLIKAGYQPKLPDLSEIDRRLVMLRTQYRMHPDISAIPNRLYYHNLLLDSPTIRSQTESISESPPYQYQPVAVLNTAALQSFCFSHYYSNSRFNPVSAFLTVELARTAAKAGQYVGIVTPYNAQARLINRLLRELKLPHGAITVATVHRFQGSERDVIIFDAVEGNGKLPGKLFAENDSAAGRLTNVAVSRAKGKFIAVMDQQYIKEKFKQDSAFIQFAGAVTHQAISNQREALQRAQWPKTAVQEGILISGTIPGLHYYPQSQDVAHLITEHLSQAREEIAISWPDFPVSTSNHFKTASLLTADNKMIPIHVTGQGINHFTHLSLQYGYRYTRKSISHTRYKIGVVSIDHQKMWLFLQPDLEGGAVLHLEIPRTISLLQDLFDLVPGEKWRQSPLS